MTVIFALFQSCKYVLTYLVFDPHLESAHSFYEWPCRSGRLTQYCVLMCEFYWQTVSCERTFTLCRHKHVNKSCLVERGSQKGRRKHRISLIYCSSTMVLWITTRGNVTSWLPSPWCQEWWVALGCLSATLPGIEAHEGHPWQYNRGTMLNMIPWSSWSSSLHCDATPNTDVLPLV